MGGGDLDRNLTHGSLPGHTRVLNPNGIWIGSAVFAGLTSVTDRQIQTDRPRNNGRIYTYVVLRCGLIIITVLPKIIKIHSRTSKL